MSNEEGRLLLQTLSLLFRHLGTHALLGGFVSISIRWMLLCEEVTTAEDKSPDKCAAHNNVLMQPWSACWCQCVATQPEPRLSQKPLDFLKEEPSTGRIVGPLIRNGIKNIVTIVFFPYSSSFYRFIV